MQPDKPFNTTPLRNISFGDIFRKPNQPGETSVLIRNNNGLPSKFIRISTTCGSINIEVEYKEEVVKTDSRNR